MNFGAHTSIQSGFTQSPELVSFLSYIFYTTGTLKPVNPRLATFIFYICLYLVSCSAKSFYISKMLNPHHKNATQYIGFELISHPKNCKIMDFWYFDILFDIHIKKKDYSNISTAKITQSNACSRNLACSSHAAIQTPPLLCNKAWLNHSFRKAGETTEDSQEFLHVKCKHLNKFFFQCAFHSVLFHKMYEKLKGFITWNDQFLGIQCTSRPPWNGPNGLELAPCGSFKAMNCADNTWGPREGLTIFKEILFPHLGLFLLIIKYIIAFSFLLLSYNKPPPSITYYASPENYVLLWNAAVLLQAHLSLINILCPFVYSCICPVFYYTGHYFFVIQISLSQWLTLGCKKQLLVFFFSDKNYFCIHKVRNQENLFVYLLPGFYMGPQLPLKIFGLFVLPSRTIVVLDMDGPTTSAIYREERKMTRRSSGLWLTSKTQKNDCVIHPPCLGVERTCQGIDSKCRCGKKNCLSKYYSLTPITNTPFLLTFAHCNPERDCECSAFW
ncbi:hypothetical protein VP01_436g4 [Puccinia sorghi]|uniref:Uncharacterized protein n=1 Tax=Puccinia sorghi TaxID=27349 RepID=A0A0L6UPS9_9BASI|nr:hypothetical protein VP01_436g4 [Puccinia sorghi]